MKQYRPSRRAVLQRGLLLGVGGCAAALTACSSPDNAPAARNPTTAPTPTPAATGETPRQRTGSCWPTSPARERTLGALEVSAIGLGCTLRAETETTARGGEPGSTMTTSAGVMEEREVSPLELFYDLVFVFAVSQLSEHLVDDLTWRGAAETLVLLCAVFTGGSSPPSKRRTSTSPAGRPRSPSSPQWCSDCS
jgi:hypothetical protein